MGLTPVVETRVFEPREDSSLEVKKSKIIPYLGAQSIKGNKVDFESKLNNYVIKRKNWRMVSISIRQNL